MASSKKKKGPSIAQVPLNNTYGPIFQGIWAYNPHLRGKLTATVMHCMNQVLLLHQQQAGSASGHASLPDLTEYSKPTTPEDIGSDAELVAEMDDIFGDDDDLFPD